MEIQLHDDVAAFIEGLAPATIAKVLRTIDLLQEFGNALGMPHSKLIDQGLFELRIRGTQEIRLFYTFHHKKAVILHGFTRKQNRIPLQEIRTAKRRKADLEHI